MFDGSRILFDISTLYKGVAGWNFNNKYDVYGYVRWSGRPYGLLKIWTQSRGFVEFRVMTEGRGKFKKIVFY